MDELFPNKTATAVELAKAEYYQGVVIESLQPVMDYFITNIFDTKSLKFDNYTYDLGEVVDGKIDSLLIIIDVTHKNIENRNIKNIYKFIFPEQLPIQNLFNKFDENFNYKNFKQIYSYAYDTTKQGDKDDFIKAVVGHFDPDFVTEDAQLLYTFNGEKLDNDYGVGKFFNIVMITTKGLRYYSVITPLIEDSQLVEYISKNKFKLNGKAEINFSNYQINVDLTKQPS